MWYYHVLKEEVQVYAQSSNRIFPKKQYTDKMTIKKKTLSHDSTILIFNMFENDKDVKQ